MNTYFTSDTHFGHQNIIKYCSRPWRTAEEMNEALIQAWNAKIAPEDEVWHLGDITFIRDLGNYLSVVERLNGRINVVFGNHDNHEFIRKCGNISAVYFGFKTVYVNGQRIELCHFPIEEWDGMHRGAWHLCGHVHNRNRHDYRTIQKLPNRLDVGVDNNPQYTPFSFEEVRGIFEKKGN